MIDFSCRCGHAFSVGEDLAGGVLQCPVCKKLNDVPLLSDIGRLDDGGIYKIGESPAPMSPQPERVAELTTIFTRDHYDSQGNAIDIRGPVGGTHGVGPVPVESLAVGEEAVPKYDPVTGELIREIEVKPSADAHSGTVPTAQRAVLAPMNVVDGIDVPGSLEVLTIPLRLLKPVNLLVMSFVLVAHLLGFAMMAAAAAGYVLLLPFWLALHGIILAHYGNVIDETGPSSRSELPTPLRHVEWHDDLWGPFTRVMIALIICYGPGSVLLTYATPANQDIITAISVGLSLVGTLFFPAVVLTTCASGSIMNARPDRLLAVAIICGAEYFLAIAAWVVGGTLWILGNFGGSALASAAMKAVVAIQSPVSAPSGMTWPIAIGTLIVGTYVLHYFCWHLGLLYRKHHQRFPWLYQRHSFTYRQDQSKGFPVGRPPKRAAKAPMRVEPIPQDPKTS